MIWMKRILVNLTLLLTGIFIAFTVHMFVNKGMPEVAGIFVLLYLATVVWFKWAEFLDEEEDLKHD